MNLCKKITDYSDNSGDVAEQQEIDDTYGVNVEFDRLVLLILSVAAARVNTMPLALIDLALD